MKKRNRKRWLSITVNQRIPTARANAPRAPPNHSLQPPPLPTTNSPLHLVMAQLLRTPLPASVARGHQSTSDACRVRVVSSDSGCPFSFLFLRIHLSLFTITNFDAIEQRRSRKVYPPSFLVLSFEGSSNKRRFVVALSLSFCLSLLPSYTYIRISRTERRERETERSFARRKSYGSRHDRPTNVASFGDLF